MPTDTLDRGHFSFGIHLLHVFAAAAMRMVAQRAGIESDLGLFALGLAAGVACPIAFELTVGRHPTVSRLVVGTSPPETPRATSTPPASAWVGGVPSPAG